MARRLWWWVWRVGLGLVVLAVVAFSILVYWTAKNSYGTVCFLVPAGYVGLVNVTYGQAGTPPLPEVNGALEVKFPESGILLTSSDEPSGAMPEAYYFYQPDGRRLAMPADHLDENLAWGRTNSSVGATDGKGPETLSQQFFVGTAQQRQTMVTWTTKPGNLAGAAPASK